MKKTIFLVAATLLFSSAIFAQSSKGLCLSDKAGICVSSNIDPKGDDPVVPVPPTKVSLSKGDDPVVPVPPTK
ncbi:MAG TPA: hypothetical protein VJ602_11665 [Paludibacter sp.]|nr:hypothetical protein [Paludibacter sp.]